MSAEIEKTYEPGKTEQKWYDFWLKNGYFSSKPEAGRKAFTIVIPPPNVTGSLHMGHALNDTLQDAIIRFRKMQGYNTLWIPGTDHGGIATQNVVEKLLKAEGTSRAKLGREKFIERTWAWRQQTGDTILNQLKRLGCSLDWDRTKFTMDEACSKAVMTAFVELYNKELIYRGKRLVNWCPRCNTALSDIEVEHEEEIGKLWHIQYPVKGPGPKESKKGEFIIVATTRPETMLGDTAVAVHPEDERYKKLIGKTLILPLTGREIPVVADEAVDRTFGTGAVKVTPAHDSADFEIAARHGLPHKVVIGFDGKMTKEAGKYAGLDRYEARKQVLLDLETQGLLLETVDHPHSVGHCYRCNTVIEPLVSEQWFLKVEDMSRRARAVVEEGKLKFYPESWARPYVLWLENLRDWCISRQIWWGHRIPVYYCVSETSIKNEDGTEKRPVTKCPLIVSVEAPKKCPACGGTHIEQDPDVLDTWFSSALWPMSVLGWPDSRPDKNNKGHRKSDIEYYYPTSVLVTGHEILYLWVARMVQMGLEFLDELPFREVFIHGIVRDRFGKKMSKSLGNVIDPLSVMEKFGTDALRFSLAQAAAPGRDMQLSDDSFIGARNFANKLWNASRFIMMNAAGVQWDKEFIMAVWPMELADKWILAEYRKTVLGVTKALEVYDIDVAARLLYEFFWAKYCDWYIEIAKVRIMGPDEDAKKAVLSMLMEILSGVIKMLHPIMPFITEELWHSLSDYMRNNNKNSSVMSAPWPEADESKVDEAAIKEMGALQEFITAIRTIRSEMNVSPGKNIMAAVKVTAESQSNFLKANEVTIKSLAKIETLEVSLNALRPKQSAVAVAAGFEIFVPLGGIIDLEKELARLGKEIANAEAELERCAQKLKNENFAKRAPEAEVAKVRERISAAELKISRLRDSITSLG